MFYTLKGRKHNYFSSYIKKKKIFSENLDKFDKRNDEKPGICSCGLMTGSILASGNFFSLKNALGSSLSRPL
jgi:hypothetical protein